MAPTGPPTVPAPRVRVPAVALWCVPLALVLTYVLLVTQYFHGDARWTGDRWVDVTLLLVLSTAALSFAWYGIAYLAANLLGEFATVGILGLIARVPGLNRHVVVTPPTRPDTAREVWGRFGILLLITLGFELIFMILVVRRGDLAPRLAISDPFRFVLDEALAGVGLGLLIAPAAPFLASRLRTRITDSLEFPLLWLAALLLVVGGVSILEVEVLRGFVIDPALFLTSVLLYAPAAWYVSLGFSRAEAHAQQRFLSRAWRHRRGRFHFGRVQVTDLPEETTTEV